MLGSMVIWGIESRWGNCTSCRTTTRWTSSLLGIISHESCRRCTRLSLSRQLRLPTSLDDESFRITSQRRSRYQTCHKHTTRISCEIASTQKCICQHWESSGSAGDRIETLQCLNSGKYNSVLLSGRNILLRRRGLEERSSWREGGYCKGAGLWFIGRICETKRSVEA